MLTYSCMESTKPVHMCPYSHINSVVFQFIEKTTTGANITSTDEILQEVKVIHKDGMVDYNLHVFHLERSRDTSNLTTHVHNVAEVQMSDEGK